MDRNELKKAHQYFKKHARNKEKQHNKQQTSNEWYKNVIEAHLLCKLKRYEESWQVFEGKVLNMDVMPLDVKAWHPLAIVRNIGIGYFYYGVYLFELGQYEAAIMQFHKVIEYKPSDPFSHYYLSLCCLQTQAFDKSKQHITRAYDLNNTISSVAGLYLSIDAKIK